MTDGPGMESPLEQPARPDIPVKTPGAAGRMMFGVAMAICLLVSFLYHSGILSISQRSDLHLVQPLAQFAAAILICRIYGRPRCKTELFLFVLANGLLVGNAWLLRSGSHLWWCRQLMAVLFRVLLCVAALCSVVGCALLLESVRRRSVRWRRWVPLSLKVCLPVLFATLVLESIAVVLEPQSSTQADLPDFPPSTSQDPFLVAAIGGSTMQGFPYAAGFGMTEVAVWQLQQMWPRRPVELQNLAVTGMNLSQSLGQLRELKRCPNLVVVYAGHNEFFHDIRELTISRKSDFGRIDNILRHSAVFRIVDVVLGQYLMNVSSSDSIGKMLGPRICTDYVAEVRRERYLEQLRQLFQWARQRNIHVVFCEPACDLSSFEPNRSYLSSSSAAVQEDVRKAWEFIRTLQRNGQTQQALDVCRQWLQEYPETAELHFRAGECLLEMDRRSEAASHFAKALELDQFPVRAKPSYVDAACHVAAIHDVPILRSRSVLQNHSRRGVPGSDLFLDGVHPNLKGTFILGHGLARLIRAHQLISDAKADQPQRAEFAEAMVDLKMDVVKLADACEETAEVLRHYAIFRPYDSQRRRQTADIYAGWANRIRQGDLQPGESGTESLVDRVPLRISPDTSQ